MISLQMADRSLRYPRGVIEDVLVKVDKFIFSMDFVVLNMEEDREIPLILSIPFLAMGSALIDVHSGNLTLQVNDKEVQFNIYHTMKFPNGGQSCNRISVVGDCVRDVMGGVLIDGPLEHCLVHSFFRKSSLSTSEAKLNGCDMEDEQLECALALDSLPNENSHEKKLEVTASVFEDSKSHEEPSSWKKEGLVLKWLPDHLRYAFLGGQSEFPVIISTSFSPR